MTTVDTSFLVTTFQPILDLHLTSYMEANEILADDASGGNRRTVAKAAAETHGTRDDYARRVIEAIAREARPKDAEGNPTGDPDISLVFHILNSFDKVLKDHEIGKAVDAYVTSEVAKLKVNVDPDRKKASDEEKAKAVEQRATAYEGIEGVRRLVEASSQILGSEAVEAFLAQIPDNVTKPRKPTGKTGPRLRNGDNPKAKYEFFDGTNNLGDQLSKVAGVLGAELSDIKDAIAAEHVTPVDGEDDSAYDERVKAWFNAAPNAFGFNVKGEKGETRLRAVVTTKVEDSSSEDDSDAE